jgi:hypothetical protein
MVLQSGMNAYLIAGADAIIDARRSPGSVRKQVRQTSDFADVVVDATEMDIHVRQARLLKR